MEFDHLGVVVADLATGRAHVSALLPVSAWTDVFQDPVQQVSVQFGHDRSGMCYELIAPSGDASPVAAALRNKANILNHVGYRVRDLDAEAARLREQRCIPLGPAAPAVAFGGARIQFFLSRYGFIVELIETERQHSFVFRQPADQEAAE